MIWGEAGRSIAAVATDACNVYWLANDATVDGGGSGVLMVAAKN